MNHARSSTSEAPRPSRTRSRFFDFHALQDEQELNRILERLGPQLGPRQLAAAFHRLKELPGAPQSSTLDHITQQLILTSDEMSANDIASILNTCTRLKFRNEDLLHSILTRLTQREVKLQLSGSLMGSILVSLGLLQDDSPLRGPKQGESTQSLQFDLLDEMRRLALVDGFLEALKTPDLVQLVSGFGMLRLHSPHLRNAICSELMKDRRLNSMRYQDLVYTWKAIAQLQIDDPNLIRMISNEVIKPERLRGFKPRELEVLLQSIKPMKSRPWNFTNTLILEISRPDRISAFNETQLTNIIQSLTVMSYRDGAVLEVFLEEVTKPQRLNLFTKTEISMIAFSFKKLKFTTRESMQKLMNKVEGVFLDSQLSEEQLLSFILGPRKSEIEAETCDKLLEELLVPERLRKLSDLTLSGLLNGLYELNITDPNKLSSCVDEIKTRLKSASTRVLSYYAYGLRTNKIQDPGILQVFVDEVTKEDKLKEFNAPQLTGVVYALGTLRWKIPETFEIILGELSQIHRINEVSEKGLANLVSILQHTGLPLTDPAVQSVLSEAVQSSRLLRYSERSLMSMIESFGRLRLRQKEWNLPLFDEITKLGRLARFTHEELGELMYNLAQMRIRSATGFENLKREITKSNRLAKFTNRDFANLIYAIGVCRITDPELIQPLINSLNSTIDVTAFKDAEISNVIHGLAALECSDQDCLMKIVLEGLKEERLSKMKNSAFSSLVYGVFQLQIDHPRFTRILIEQIGKPNRLDKFTNHQLTNVAVSLMKAGSSLELPMPSELITELSKPDRIPRFEAYQLVELTKCLALNGSSSDLGHSRLIEMIVEEIKKPDRRTSMSKSNLASISRHLSEFGFRDHVILKSISDELIDRFLQGTTTVD